MRQKYRGCGGGEYREDSVVVSVGRVCIEGWRGTCVICSELKCIDKAVSHFL